MRCSQAPPNFIVMTARVKRPGFKIPLTMVWSFWVGLSLVRDPRLGVQELRDADLTRWSGATALVGGLLWIVFAAGWTLSHGSTESPRNATSARRDPGTATETRRWTSELRSPARRSRRPGAVAHPSGRRPHLVTGRVRRRPQGSGRRTGTPRQVTFFPVDVDGTWYLLSQYGVTDWVRNLRAAGRGELRRRVARRPSPRSRSRATSATRSSLSSAPGHPNRFVGTSSDSPARPTIRPSGWSRSDSAPAGHPTRPARHTKPPLSSVQGPASSSSQSGC